MFLLCFFATKQAQIQQKYVFKYSVSQSYRTRELVCQIFSVSNPVRARCIVCGFCAHLVQIIPGAEQTHHCGEEGKLRLLYRPIRHS